MKIFMLHRFVSVELFLFSWVWFGCNHPEESPRSIRENSAGGSYHSAISDPLSDGPDDASSGLVEGRAGRADQPVLPVSKVGPFRSGEWTLQISAENSQHDPDRWLGLDERQVFLRSLHHRQNGSDWTLKIGKGGQIYSISTPETGEMIAFQRASHGQWVDEVFQHTIPSDTHNAEKSGRNIVDGDIHQAGYYTKSDLEPHKQLLEKSIYSPVFSVTPIEFLNPENGLGITTWPQHAHLPWSYSENGMLMHQLTRDLGDGVIEISMIIEKWHGELTRLISLPWVGWRRQSLPVVLLSRPDGTYEESKANFAAELEQINQDIGYRKLRKAGTHGWKPDTGGWIALAQSSEKNSHGIGIVFGMTASEIEEDRGFVRWGAYGTDRDGGTVTAVKRSISLSAGETVYARYFLVIGTVSKIQDYANMLQAHVKLGKFDSRADQTSFICLSEDERRKIRRGCRDPKNGFFFAERNYSGGFKPLFMLGRKDGRFVLTADPNEGDSKPTDGETLSWNFLGWALPSPGRGPFRYVTVGELSVDKEWTVSGSAASLYVRRDTVGIKSTRSVAP